MRQRSWRWLLLLSCVGCAFSMKKLFWLAVQLAPTGYLSLHNMVVQALHWHLCSTFGLHPLLVGILTSLCLKWRTCRGNFCGFGVHTLSLVGSNRPDIVVFLKGDTVGSLKSVHSWLAWRTIYYYYTNFSLKFYMYTHTVINIMLSSMMP